MSDPRPNKVSILRAAQRGTLVIEKTRDARIYDVKHWYSSCGDDVNPGLLL